MHSGRNPLGGGCEKGKVKSRGKGGKKERNSCRPYFVANDLPLSTYVSFFLGAWKRKPGQAQSQKIGEGSEDKSQAVGMGQIVQVSSHQGTDSGGDTGQSKIAPIREAAFSLPK